MWYLLIVAMIIILILSVWLFRLNMQKSSCEKKLRELDDSNKILFDHYCALSLTEANYEEACLSLNSMIDVMMQKGYPSYFKVYKKALNCKPAQSAVLVMYEHSYSSSSCMKEGVNVNDLIVSRKLSGHLYYDGTLFDPFLIQTLRNDCDFLYIEELNISKIADKGIGSFILSCIEEEAVRLGFIKVICGSLALADIGRREQLIHFYKKNGFTIEEYDEPVNGNWGRISKNI